MQTGLRRLRKLLAMSPAEIAARAREAAVTRLEEAAFRLGRRPGIRPPRPAMDGARFFPAAWDAEARRAALEQAGADRQVLADAGRILKGEICLFGRWVPLPRGEGWHADPLGRGMWPRTFFSRVRESDGPGGADPKHVWEANRHQFLVTLGRAWFLTRDERYAGRVRAVVGDWIAHNPYNQGVNWCSALELAVRAMSWIWAVQLCRGADALGPEFREEVARSLAEHGLHLSRHLSLYSSPYNHLVGEATGLMLIGALLGMEPWERTGWEVIASRVEEQFHPDGMSVEQATYYHHWTLGFYLLAIAFRRLNGRPVGDAVLSRVEKALECSMLMMRPDGTQPMFGDIDNARSLYAGFAHSWDFRGLLAVGAALFEREDFKFAAGGQEADLLWLVPEEDLERYRRLPAREPGRASAALPRSGYWVFRDSWTAHANYLCFDCGPIAAGLRADGVPSAAHGHADALSFELCAHGRPVLVDAGFFTYFGDPDWHRGFREEEAHNTVVVEGLRQAEYAGMMAWRFVRGARAESWTVANGAEAVRGTVEHPGGLRVRRWVAYEKPLFWAVVDRVEGGRGGETVSVWLHFDPAVDLEADQAAGVLVARRDGAGLTVRFLDRCRLDRFRAGPDPARGWVAPGYGMKEPAWAVRAVWEPGVRRFRWLMVPWKEDPPDIRVQELDEAGAALKVGVAGAERTVRMEG